MALGVDLGEVKLCFKELDEYRRNRIAIVFREDGHLCSIFQLWNENFVVYVKKLEVDQTSITHIVNSMIDGPSGVADNSSIILLNRDPCAQIPN